MVNGEGLVVALFKKPASNAVEQLVAALLQQEWEDVFSEVSPGIWIGRQETAAVFVIVDVDDEGFGTVTVDSPILQKVRPTADLYQSLLTQRQFRSFRWEVDIDADDGSAMIRLGVPLLVLNNEFAAEQLIPLIQILGNVADEIDDDLRAHFGGYRFFE